MTATRKRTRRVLLALGLASLLALSLLVPVGASSHREAPLISKDPVADNTDVYAFMTGENLENLTIVSNWIPLEEPASGPNFWKFGDDVLYEVEIDNNGDSFTDIEYEFRFATTIKNPNTFLYNTGPITFNAEEETYDGLNIEQRYSVTEVRNGHRETLASGLLTPPVRVGVRSTDTVVPYEELAQAAVHEIELPEGKMKVFAGQRDEAFPVDLGSIFDLGGLRPFNPFHLIPLPEEPGINTTTGFNVHSIVMEIPKERVVEDDPVIGLYSTTYRRKTRVFRDDENFRLEGSGPWVQISRLGNPLVNEVVIPLGMKDEFNHTEAPDDERFLEFILDPILGELLPVLYPDVIEVPEPPRNDLVTIFLTGIPGLNQPENVVPSEMLRINTNLPSGFPNGRRLGEDVVDIELRAVAGIFCDVKEKGPGCEGFTLEGSPFNVFPNNALSDGVSGNDMPFLEQFPYMPTPHSGYDHIHDHSNRD
ncbi:MAG: DUF4331 domain-containing protein [Actinomycetota bacterium]|nr:DUF4331 domain-containing protein [Actinomycetota bacterium]